MMYVQKGEPTHARQRLQAALAIFLRLGARPYIERTSKALTELDQP